MDHSSSQAKRNNYSQNQNAHNTQNLRYHNSLNAMNTDYENKQRFYQNSNYNTQQGSGYGSDNSRGDRNVRNYNNEQEDYSAGRGRNYSAYYNQFDDGNNYANFSGQRAHNDYSSNSSNSRKPRR